MATKAAAKTTAAAKPGKNKKFKKRERKNVPFGLVFIQATFNNTIVTITDQQGNTLSWKSSGSLGFRGSRKGTPFAAQQAAVNAATAARDHGVRSVDVRVAGPGSSAAAIRSRIRSLRSGSAASGYQPADVHSSSAGCGSPETQSIRKTWSRYCARSIPTRP